MEGLGSSELSIKNLPPELNLENVLNLELQDMLNLCSTNSKFREICKKYEELIYNNLLKRDFGFYNEKIGSKIVYKLLYEISKWDRNLTPFNIYKPIQEYDYKGLQHLVDLGFLNKTRYVNTTPLEYVIINYNKIPNEKQGVANKIIDLIVKITISSDNITPIELKSYILSKMLSSKYKRQIIDVCKHIINTKYFLEIISSEYYNPKLHDAMEYMKSLVKSDLQKYIYPISTTILQSIENNDIQTLNELLMNKKYTNDELNSSLLLVIGSNNIDLINLLLNNGGDINHNKGYPLKYAIDSVKVNAKTIEHLINRGANVMVGKNSILKLAIKRRRYDIMKLLLEKTPSDKILPDIARELFKIFRLKVRLDLERLLESKGFTNPYPHIEADSDYEYR